MTSQQEPIARHEVLLLLAVEESFLATLEREEIVQRTDRDLYAPAMVERVRICHALHFDLGVNLAGLDVALTLLGTIKRERRQVQRLLAALDAKFGAGKGEVGS